MSSPGSTMVTTGMLVECAAVAIAPSCTDPGPATVRLTEPLKEMDTSSVFTSVAGTSTQTGMPSYTWSLMLS